MQKTRCVVPILAITLCGAALAADESSKDAQNKKSVSYYRDVRPILQQHCQGCHQPAKALGQFVMLTHADLMKPGESKVVPIKPGKPEESELYIQITSVGNDPPAMPKGKPPLINTQVDLIKRWIAEGAKDDTPAVARTVVDMQHPPKYSQTPVITSVAFSPDGKILAISGYHEVLLHSADGATLIGRLVGLAERIQSLAFSPDGKSLAVTGGSPGRFGEVQIWNVEKRSLDLSVPITYDTIYGASWSPDGKLLAFGCGDNSVRVIQAASGNQVLFQGAHSDWALDTVFSLKGTHLVSVSRDQSMKLTEVATQRFIDNVTSITPGALKGGLMAIDRHPTKDEVLAGGADGQPKIYRIFREQVRVIGDDFNLIRAFDPLPGRLFDVAFSADGKRIVAASSNDGAGEVRVYQTDDGKLVSKLAGQKGGVFAVAFDPAGKTVASAGFDGIVRLNEADTGNLIKEFVPVPLEAAPTVAATP